MSLCLVQLCPFNMSLKHVKLVLGIFVNFNYFDWILQFFSII